MHLPILVLEDFTSTDVLLLGLNAVLLDQSGHAILRCAVHPGASHLHESPAGLKRFCEALPADTIVGLEYDTFEAGFLQLRRCGETSKSGADNNDVDIYRPARFVGVGGHCEADQASKTWDTMRRLSIEMKK